MTRRIICILLIACAFLGIAQQPAMNEIKQKKQDAQQEINKTSQKIKQNKNKTVKSLNDLNRTTAEIKEKQRTINDLSKQIAEINIKIEGVNKEIALQDSALKKLRANYLNAVKKMRSHRVSANKLMFVFSSETFHQAYRRMRYLKEFARWRDGQSEQIKAAMEELDKQKGSLIALQEEKNKAYSTINNTRLALERKKGEQSRMIAGLKAEQSDLEQVLKQQQRKLDELDRELNRLIEEEERKAAEKARIEAERRRAEEAEKARKAEEARKKEEERIRKEQEKREEELRKNKEQQRREAEKKRKEELKRRQKELERQQEELRKEQERLEKERKKAREEEEKRRNSPDIDEDIVRLNGSFESNKGKLPAPVSGSYRVVKPFGKHKHPVLEYVTTDNPGIEIEADAEATVRSVFNGTVSYIYQVSNEYNYVVIVKHGNYMSVYAGLKTIVVKKGDSVNAGQALGTLFADVNDENHSLLHFQIRKGSTKLDPQQWLK